ncbi:MAG TPA: hypothetical protein VEC19_19940 [Usitatibacter sp.]|nr:hypothetical protein [Usitatibacter sp.]
MESLDHYLRKYFAKPGAGDRRVAVGDAHAVFEEGYDVSYSRWSVTYRDRAREWVVPAELDEEGDLHLEAPAWLDARAKERIATGLAFLGVKFAGI